MRKQTATVLVVDDEPAVRSSLTDALTLRSQPGLSYDVHAVGSGEQALDQVRSLRPDLVLLDVMMPGIDGLEVCRVLRADGDRTPILMLTAKSTSAERIDGLDAGADDYVVKPYDLGELLARVRALLRRAGTEVDPVPGFADLVLDEAARQGRRGERVIQFTETEFALLELLVRNAGQVLSRELIVDRVWGYVFGPTGNSVDVYVRYLRRKLEAGGEPRLVHTVRGIGYQVREP